MTSTAPMCHPTRVSWRLSPAGTTATCIALTDAGPRLEIRRAGNTATVGVPGLDPHSLVAPADDGLVWVVTRDGEGAVLQRISRGVVETRRSLPRSGGMGMLARSAGRPPLLLRSDRSGHTTVGGAEHGGVAAHVAGIAEYAQWLDGERMVIGLLGTEGSTRVVILDLASGSLRDLPTASELDRPRLMGVAPTAGMAVLQTVSPAGRQLDLLPIDSGAPGAGSRHIIGPSTFLAIQPDGRRFATMTDLGATSRLFVTDTADGHRTEVPLPPLTIHGTATMLTGELVAAVSTTDRAGTLMRVDTDTHTVRFDDPPAPDAPPCRIEAMPGAETPIETLIYGDLESANQLVLALHGGPVSAWTAAYHPLFAALAANGCAVVAANVRGSSRYGKSHRTAISNHWGESDLADVIAIGQFLRRSAATGVPLLLLGESYGGYLALLAAERNPALWSKCVAMCPFVSGARLVAAGGPVAAFVQRAGGATSADLLPEIREQGPPVLLLHGAADAVIPVQESTALANAFRDRNRPVTFARYPDGGHDLLAGGDRASVIATVVRFCVDAANSPEWPVGEGGELL